MEKKWEDELNQQLEVREELSKRIEEEINKLLNQAESLACQAEALVNQARGLTHKAETLKQALGEKENENDCAIANRFTFCLGGWIEIELKEPQNRNEELVSKVTGRIIGVTRDELERWKIEIIFQNKITSYTISQIKSIRIIGD